MNGQPPKTRFTLRTDREALVLKTPPEGYDKYSDSWIFNAKPEGFGYNEKRSTITLKFVEEGADFIRRQIGALGLNADIEIVVEVCQENWTYKVESVGRIDLYSRCVDEQDSIEVDVYQGGLKQSLVEKSRTNYEIPLAEAEEVEVPEGMNLFEQARYTLGSMLSGTSEGWIPNLSLESGVAHSIGIVFDNLDRENDSNSFLHTLSTNPPTNVKPGIYKAKFILSVVISDEYPNLDYDTTVAIRVGAVGSSTILESIIIPNTQLQANETFTKEVYFDINVNSEENYYYWTWSSIPAMRDVSVVIEFFGNASTGPFKFKAYKVSELGDRVLKKMHPGASFGVTFLSQMERFGKQLFITSGDGIRGIPGALVKTNMKEIETLLSCVFSTGLVTSIAENTHVVDDLHNILDPNRELLDLGEAQKLNVLMLGDDWMYNNIKVGSEKQETDYPLGRQDPFCTMEFSTDLKIPNNAVDLAAKCITGYAPIRMLQYEYVNSDKKDSKSDNRLVLIWAYWENGKWVASQGDVEVEGLEGGGYFNLELTPKRCLRRRSAYFRSMLNTATRRLYYQSSDETMTNIRTRGASETDWVVEKGDESLNDSDYILFKPFAFKFECIVPRNLSAIVGENPLGYFKFRYNGRVLKGFPIDINGRYENSKQEVTCVAHPDTPDNINSLLFSRNRDVL